MKKASFLLLGGSMVMLLMVSATAWAVPISHTWDFHLTCYTTGVCNDTWEPVGNERTASSDQGLNVTVSAFSFTDPDGTGPSVDSWLGQYIGTEGGLGVSNSAGDSSHTVDNIGYSDYVVFEFAQPVTVASYYLSIFDDGDSTWYVGNLTPGFDFTNKSLADVNALGLTMGTNSWNASTDPNPLEMISTGVAGNYLILASRLSTGDTDDEFKIRSITATQDVPDPVPEPGTLVLVGSGLTILGFVIRRRWAGNALRGSKEG